MSKAIESVLTENRLFKPPPGFDADIGGAYFGSLDEYRVEHKRSIEDPEGYWGEIAQELRWFKPWDKVLEWNAPDAKWFVGATTHLCYNCVDRQVAQGHGDDPAIIW